LVHVGFLAVLTCVTTPVVDPNPPVNLVDRSVSSLMVSPNSCYVGESVVVSAVLDPAPPSGYLYSDCYFDIVKPNGASINPGPINSDSD